MPERLILVGQIGQAHGLKGEVKLTSFTADPEALVAYSPLLTADGRKVTVEKMKPAKGAFFAILKDVRERNAAEALKGEKLFVPRDKLPEPADGEYYHADLIGLALETPAGEAVGIIEAMVNYGGGDLMDVRLADGSRSVLVPFKGADVDLKAGKVRLELPEGLLEA